MRDYLDELRELQVKLVNVIVKQQGLYDHYEESTIEEQRATYLLEIQAFEAMKKGLNDRITMLGLEKDK